MEEDLELLQSMYVNDKELYVGNFNNIKRLHFFLSELVSNITDKIALVISIMVKYQIVNDVKLVSENNQTILVITEKMLGLQFSDSLPSKILEHTINNMPSLLSKFNKLCSSLRDGNEKEGECLELLRIVYDLDHIRNLKKYQKCLTKFAKQTGCCCLLFCDKNCIRLVVEGQDAREFVRLHRTSLVDVDSNGKFLMST